MGDMKSLKISAFFLFHFLILYLTANGQVYELPNLHVEGRYLKDTHGNNVNLHGFAQTYSPWFNEQGKYWDNYNVAGCLAYNQNIIDKIFEAGWKVNFIRLHMDPYWTNEPGCTPDYWEASNCFSETRFKKHLDEVFIPMAEYALSKGLYVMMRPPGVCPVKIEVGDFYNQYLIKVWAFISKHPKLINRPGIMFELANEPVNILGSDGTYGASGQGHFDNLKAYFQTIVDTIRSTGSQNVLWIPGLGYQSLYKGYAINPINGNNIGYAVHIYPGWFDEGEGYTTFKNSWDKNVKPVADFAPIVVTEMDWAPEKYQASWGKGITGVAGGEGFGANFKAITDTSGNVSWLIFTEPHRMAQFDGVPPGNGVDTTFLNDPQACPFPTYQWYNNYAELNYPRPEFKYQSHSDNGNGTYTNPVVFGDFPDPDVIRVNDTYYMVSTTMYVFPGATILKSNDLVNWEFCCNPLEMIESSDCYNLNNCNRYARGQWAASLKYNKGKFYLHFNTLNEGSYLLSTANIYSKWAIKKLQGSYYDGGLFFDDNNKCFMVHGINNIRITELDENFDAIAGTDKLVFTSTFRDGLEGSHLYKINSYYYIYATYGGFPAFQVALRSKNIYGPYEEKKLLEDDNIHQGALIETQTGEWWTVLFYDKGPYGRLPNLQPITWIDNWPIIGLNGKGVTNYKKPDVGKTFPIKSLSTNDNFRDDKLGLQWGWNHNSDNSKWSLVENPGFMRLKTAGIADSLLGAKNTLTQRVLSYYSEGGNSYGTIALHIDSMKNGDKAGLSLFSDPYTAIGVNVTDGKKHLELFSKNNSTSGPMITDSVIYLRIVTNFITNKANFYYSLNNKSYTKFGNEVNMGYDYFLFTGIKFGIFNYATLNTGGFVDVDWFSTEEQFSEDTFYDPNFTGFSENALTLDRLELEPDSIEMLIGTVKTIKIYALFLDGHSEDVTLKATFNNQAPEVATIINGQIISKKEGNTTIAISYTGSRGDEKSAQLYLSSMMFPLTKKLFNPSIFADGTFNEQKKELTTGLYGFGGWQYENGLNLSDYKYLLVKLANENKCGASFRIFDEANYWSQPFTHDVGNLRQLVIDLHHMEKELNGKKVNLDPSHLYLVGFWSFGNAPIAITEISVTNSDNYQATHNITLTNSAPEKLNNGQNENSNVDVYNLLGARIRTQVKYEQAIKGLPTGLYIIGNKKIFIHNP